jgi:hypothetical protein
VANRRVSQEQAREHERRAWELRQEGWTQTRIAAALDLDRASVHHILHRVSLRVLAELSQDAKARKAEQDAQLSYLLDEALLAWRRSCGVTSDPQTGAPTPPTQPGDPRFLAEARAVLADVRKLWGLEPGQGHQPGAPLVRITRIEVVDDGDDVLALPAPARNGRDDA